MRNLTAATGAALTDRYDLQSKAKGFAQWAQALMIAKGDVLEAREVFASRFPQSKHLDTISKAAVSAGTTTGWGEPLTPLTPLGMAYIDFVRPRTVLGRLLGVRPVPFDVPFAGQTSGFGVGWTREGKPILVTKGEFQRNQLSPTKIGGIVVQTEELLRSTDAAAQAMIERDLSNAVVEFSDVQFLDPAIAEVEGTSPASITHGAPEIDSTGDDAEAVETDLKAMVASLIAAGSNLVAPFWVMKPGTALHLATLRGPGGERIFPNVGPLGGEIWTIPVLTSVSAGDQITLIDAAEVLVADGGIELSASQQGALQMSDAPVDGPAEMVSLWQSNLVALKVIRFIRWARHRTGSVAWMTVTY